jgi:hypothetical protein
MRLGPTTRRLTPEERNELLMIMRIQRLNCYEALIHRLTQGESANAVALWAFNLKPEGPASAWSYFYWRKHVLALRRRVRVAKEKLRTRTPVAPKPQAVAAYVEMEQALAAPREVIPERSRQVWKDVKAALKEIEAEHIAKYALIKQLERVEVVTEFEKKAGIPLPNAHKEIETLTHLAEVLFKIETGTKLLRGKDGIIPIEQPYQTWSGDLQHDDSELARGMRTFDEVDRNLLRQAGKRVIQLIRGEAIGRFAPVGLEPNPEATTKTDRDGTSEAQVKDVRQGPQGI